MLKITDTMIIGNNKPCFIIAEGGINHQGDVNIAKKLIDMAKECGADCIKFQKRTVERILTKEGLDKPYLNENSFGTTYGEHKYKLELSNDNYYELKKYADEKNILFTASAWDEESADFLYELNVPFIKIASADITNFPLLEHIAKKNKPIILSTGMSDMQIVIDAVNHIKQWNNNLALLQCTSSYPSRDEDINLNVISTYKNTFPDIVIGYSGHENGVVISSAAVAMGAKIIERHITLDRTMKGGDHAASLEKTGFTNLCEQIRKIEKAFGSFEKKRMPLEEQCFIKLSKSIVSTINIKKGTKIERNMLTTKGPGTGISPMYINNIIGKIAQCDIDNDKIIQLFDILLFKQDKELANIFNNKTVAYVCPGYYMTGLNYGSDIEKCDVVCRCNTNEFIDDDLHKDYGQRTDIILSCCNSRWISDANKEYVNSVKHIINIRNNNEWGDNALSELSIDKYLQTQYNVPIYQTNNKYNEYIYNFFKTSENINSGLLGLLFLLNYNIKTIYLYGMDFYDFGNSNNNNYYYKNYEKTNTCNYIHPQLMQILIIYYLYLNKKIILDKNVEMRFNNIMINEENLIVYKNREHDINNFIKEIIF